MEIPYVVTPRKDTGLINSKIAIWLFLASEVMLFGGFFSAYVFLRLGADYPWPERTLPVLPGFINTLVLILSSVTVVFAWASLKLRQWRKFQLFMGITLICSVIFMGFKALEYNVKFHHQAVRLNDYTVLEGHLSHDDSVTIDAAQLTYSTVRFHSQWINDVIAQAQKQGSTIKLAADVIGGNKAEGGCQIIAKKGDLLSVSLLESLKKAHLSAKSVNSELRTNALQQAWVDAKREYPGKKDWEISSKVNINEAAMLNQLKNEIATVSFQIEPSCKLVFSPRDVKEGDSQSRLRDDTSIEGKLVDSPMVFHYVDAIDFRHLAMKAAERGLDPVKVIDDSWLVKNHAFAREAWEWNKQQVSKIEKELELKHGIDPSTGKPTHFPTDKERFRIGWQDFVSKSEHLDRDQSQIKLKEHFMGPDYAGRSAKHTFPEHFSLPRNQVSFASKFAPAWNTYYALYFTITGLHGLHVIGGALVLGYYLFFGRKMYQSNPEWLANRVEVGGLFWHFVDLVWIFVFPIFYLM